MLILEFKALPAILDIECLFCRAVPENHSGWLAKPLSGHRGVKLVPLRERLNRARMQENDGPWLVTRNCVSNRRTGECPYRPHSQNWRVSIFKLTSCQIVPSTAKCWKEFFQMFSYIKFYGMVYLFRRFFRIFLFTIFFQL